MRAIKSVTPPPPIWIDEASKAKILSETDPDTIIRNFEKYSKATAASLDHLSDEEWCERLDTLRRLTVSFIEVEQGEVRPFKEVAAELRALIKEKCSHAALRNNNKQDGRKRSF
ncbi:MAG TPA: hypothetical protein VGV92_03485 [Gammaproteobacteria bacterium]|nr:hypothetical protein [Gammaproteobacteria bacterium]